MKTQEIKKLSGQDILNDLRRNTNRAYKTTKHKRMGTHQKIKFIQQVIYSPTMSYEGLTTEQKCILANYKHFKHIPQMWVSKDQMYETFSLPLR